MNTQSNDLHESLSNLNLRFGLGALGGLIAAAGVFLPQVHANTAVPILHNTLIGGDPATGGFVLLLALVAVVVSYRSRNLSTVYGRLVSQGVLLTVGAVWAGTGSRVELHSAGKFVNESMRGSAGIGIWAIGIGGVLIMLAGCVHARASEAPSLDEGASAEPTLPQV